VRKGQGRREGHGKQNLGTRKKKGWRITLNPQEKKQLVDPIKGGNEGQNWGFAGGRTGARRA